MSKEERLTSYLPNDHEIIKETQEDGTILFKHPVGGQVSIDDIDLYSAVYGWLSKFQTLVNMLDDGDYGKFGTLFELILQNAESELKEIFSFIRQTIGHIQIETVARDSFPYRTGRVVSLSVKKLGEEVTS